MYDPNARVDLDMSNGEFSAELKDIQNLAKDIIHNAKDREILTKASDIFAKAQLLKNNQIL